MSASCSQLTLAERASMQRRGGAFHRRRPPPGRGLVTALNPRVLARLRLGLFLAVQGLAGATRPCNVYGLDNNFLRSDAEGAGGIRHLEFQMTRVTLIIA